MNSINPTGPAGREVTPAGDNAAAFVAALRSHGRTVLDYVTRHIPDDLRGWLDPQDVLQETFFDAFRSSDSFPIGDPDAAARWLMTVARNRLVGHLRRRRAEKRGGGVADRRIGLGDSLEGMLHELGVYSRTPSRSAVARELFSAVDEALDQLPSDYAQVIRLRHIQGLSQKDTANRMGRSEKAIERLCSRGLAELRIKMRSASLFV